MTRLVSVGIDWSVFGMYIDAARTRLRMSDVSLARSCMIPADDVRRAIAGKKIEDQSFIALCTWLGHTPEFFLIKKLQAAREATL